MSSTDEIYFSYFKKGFLYQFSAIYDSLLSDWNVSFLVYHVNDKAIYLGEYARFRRQVLRKLNKLDSLEDRNKIIDNLDYKYVGVIAYYLKSYVERIQRNQPRNVSIINYGQLMVDKLIELISILKIDDLKVTKLDQKNMISFYFVWNKIIVATYCLHKNTEQSNFSSDY